MIRFSPQHIEAIKKHGERDYPLECCGFLIGMVLEQGDKRVFETYPISNAREEEHKRNRFLIRPEELLRGERYAQERDLDVVGFYHSSTLPPMTGTSASTNAAGLAYGAY